MDFAAYSQPSTDAITFVTAAACRADLGLAAGDGNAHALARRCMR
jgi:hypothetical protein